jgi:hypothetical protein
MPDGFGSTHAAASNYVEQATAAAALAASPPVSSGGAPVAEGPAITLSLQTVAARLAQSGLRGVEVRNLETVKEAIGMVSGLLASGSLQDPEVVSRLVELCRALDRGDFATAHQHMAELVRTCWADHKDWLKGLKSLTVLCRKKWNT